jgi:hypothetical protein
MGIFLSPNLGISLLKSVFFLKLGRKIRKNYENFLVNHTYGRIIVFTLSMACRREGGVTLDLFGLPQIKGIRFGRIYEERQRARGTEREVRRIEV